jgi:hypothetical protein
MGGLYLRLVDPKLLGIAAEHAHGMRRKSRHGTGFRGHEAADDLKPDPRNPSPET